MRMRTNTKTTQQMLGGENSCWLRWLHRVAAMVVMFVGLMAPQGAWADLRTMVIGDVNYYVLNDADDWYTFSKLVDQSGGKQVNAIMNSNITVNTSIALSDGVYYTGTFNGNGHTLNVQISGGGLSDIGPFAKVKDGATFRDLRVTGSVSGGDYIGGLIGRVQYSGHPTIRLDRVWVSANVTSSSNVASGIIGHASQAITEITDCRYDGKINSSTFQCCILWSDDGDERHWNRVYEKATTDKSNRFGFSYLYYFGSGGEAWGGDGDINCSLLLSSHNWTEMASGCKNITDYNTVLGKMNNVSSDKWESSWYNGAYEAVPIMQKWYAYNGTNVNFSTYDMVPSKDEKEKGMLKIPFSCDQPVHRIYMSYTNQNGTKIEKGINFPEKTYSGFVTVSATDQHKSLHLYAYLPVDGCSNNRKDEDDRMMHKAEVLTATQLRYSTNHQLSDGGAVQLKWKVKNTDCKDIIDGDQFIVLRGFENDVKKMKTIGSVLFEQSATDYSFKDSLITADLTEAQLQGDTVKAYYVVMRASARELWGASSMTTAAQTVMPLSQLHLLRVSDYQTAWADQTARTVKVTWQYADEAAAVWDSRAKMNIVVSATNRDGNLVDTRIVTLTEADMAARQKVIALDRSCVDYKITFDVERGESAIPVASSYFEIRTAEDWNTFCTMVENAGGKSNVNASLMADISVTNMVGANSSKPFQGTFEGNGHTLTVNINKNEQCVAPFRYVGNAIIRNLHTAGSVTTNNKFAAGLVSRVSDNYHLLIEGCHVSVDINSSVNGDATNGGIVAIGNDGSTITIQNSKFDGKLRGTNCYANGGIVGYTTGEVRIDNTLFDPKEISTYMSSCETWSRKGGSGSVTVTNSHCTKEYKAATTSASEFPGYFIINSSADWNTFCNKVNQAQENSDVNAVLNADITVTKQVDGRYRGTFDGNGHTININLDTYDYGAVFRSASYCTIKNLHVTGNIKGSNQYSDASSIIGSTYSDSEVYTADFINCRVSATIKGYFAGGIIGSTGGSKITLTNCLFDGNLVGNNSESHGSAFVGRRNSNDAPPTLNNCLDHGTYQSFASKGLSYNGTAQTPAGSNNWSYNGLTGATAVGSLSASDLAAKLGSGWKVEDGNAVPVMPQKVLVVSGDVAGKTADEIVALLGSGWQKDASGNPVPKMANNAQQAIPYSAKHPFNIHTTADWDAFRKLVAEAKGQKDICAQLLADISVTTPVGDTSAPYRGTFDGNGHTLTFNVSNSNQMFIAPFVSVNAATIRSLHTTGSISTSNMRAAGLVGQVPADGKLLIEGCHVSMDIYSSVSGDASSGGIVAGGGYSNVSITIRNTKFDGKMRGSSSNANGGIVGWCTAQVLIENTLFDPAEISTDPNYSQTWCRIGSTGSVTTNNCYCTREFNGNPGNAATMSVAELVKALGSQWWQMDAVGSAVPKAVGGVIDGMPTFYYENLGHIDTKSLNVQTNPTSTLLTWANVDDEPVDYYEVWRRDKDKDESDWKAIATQITERQYLDKATSPVQQYIYKVRGVTDCEGTSYDETEPVEGFCEQFGTVTGHLRFLDGTGIPGKKVFVTVGNEEVSYTTDESGFFRLTNLPYVNKAQTHYSISVVGIMGLKPVDVTFGTYPGDNVVTGKVIEVGESVKLSGYVMYDGTSIPVQGVSFKVDGYEVKTASGRVETDHEGKFAFRMLKGAHDSIQAVKDGHVFWRDGFYHEKDNDPDSLKAYDYTADKAGIRFYDQTRVKLIGRVVGGKTQGELPLGNALSKNNLGDDLQMVFVLEGDNASRLVFDNQDRSKTTRDEVFLHEQANKNDSKHTYQTKVHTTINRMVVTPDPYTGEYEVLLPPVKWKIQQITAKGYSTLFQEGQVGDVLDLSDSITLYRDTLKGEWKTSGDHTELSQVVEEYHAKYSRVYRSPILIEYKQQGFGKFDFFGDQYYSFKNVTGSRQKLTLAYEAPLGGTREGVIYTFGYPVFSIDKNYPLWLTASEKYYYNNNTKSDTVDVVSIPGGVVTIHNGFYDTLHRDTVHLDSLGQATYVMQIAQKPFLLTGDDALQTMSVTLLQDGTHYEAEPLKGYVFSLQQATGAQDILSYSEPLLIDILRDPPGGSSHATLSKGSTLKRAYTMEMEWKAGMQIGLGAGTKFNTSLGIVAAPFGIGVTNDTELTIKMSAESQINMVFSGSGERAFEYTMTTTEDISTSSDPKLVGADGDLFIGTVQNIVVKPATAIRAIPDSTFSQAGGLLESGRMVEIAQGLDDSGNTLHLVRDEVLTYGPTLQSNFVHSQHYIVNQLIPELTEQCQSLMFTGTADEARAQANATGKPVYRSKVGRESDDFGVKYEMILPEGANAGEFQDEVNRYHKSLMAWIEMLARNEDEKLNARDFVANYDVDGGSTVSYSETFESSYSAMNSFVSPFTPITDGYFDNGLANAAAFIGTMAARLIGFSSGTGLEISVEGLGVDVSVKLSPVASFNVTPKHTESKTFNRTESFEVSMDKRSHLDFDVYRVSSVSENVAGPLSEEDVFVGSNFWDQVDYNNEYLDREFKTKSFRYPMSFVYRTRGGATCRPWEDERRTKFSRSGTVLDVRTKKIENPIIKIDKQSVSGVPYGEPARFKLYITNESEQPEATYIYFDLYQADMSNPDGAHLMIDGMPLTGTSRTIEVHPGQVTEKTLDVYAGEKFDYEGLRIGIISQEDIDCYSEVTFDVHYLQTAGPIAISSPGDKWIMNCDAPQEKGKGWYLPVVIGGFDKNQHNFDHIEFQYKETTRGDDYWTNLCGYYADSTLYRAASGTKAMIPENGNIMTRFFGEGTVMEKGYDLRAVLFCRNGNAFLTSESKVLTGVKDTRRPQLFGTPEPKDGILRAGENIIFNFSEDIEYNYLQATTNFEVMGETNETAVVEAPSLQFTGDGYARSQARRNFADKNVTIEVMVKPESTGQEMPIFSHGSDGKHLQLWLTKEHHLMAIVENGDQPHIVESEKPIGKTGFQRVALVLDNENRQLMLYNDEQVATMDSVSYSGFGPLTFGYAETINSAEPFYYTGRMLQGRLWDRKLDLAGLNRYGGQLLTGYELGLVDYYPMNDGTGDEAKDYAQGGHLILKGASWAQPEGMALKITPDKTEASSNSNIKLQGLKLNSDLFERDDEQDYTLMFWFKTAEENGTLLANGSGAATDEDARNSFFIGFEGHTLKYRTNGREFALGDNLCNDTWHHYAMIVNRTRNVASIYIDNELKAQLATDTLGGMLGNRFFLGNMVWQESGDPDIMQDNPLTGYIDGLALFEQALPATLVKRYSTKSPMGTERGLKVYMDFDRQEMQKSGELALMPYALSKVVKRDNDGKDTGKRDSVFAMPVDSIMARIDQHVGAPLQAAEHLRVLNFSYIGRTNQLEVDIDETNARINKRNIYVTVSEIPDKNGNFMASAATEYFYVDRNPLKWAKRHVIQTLGAGMEESVEMDIVNKSGKAHTFTIDNLPRWLTVDKVSGEIEPMDEEHVIFTVSKDLNVGTYDQIIYVTDEEGMSEPLFLELTIEGEAPQWTIDPERQRYSMNIVAQVYLNNILVTDKRDKVAAFDADGNCVGVNNIDYDAATGRSMLYLTAYDSTAVGDLLFFRLWHYTTGKTMQISASPAVTFAKQTIAGTVDDPVLMYADNMYLQTIDLAEGWNWMSFNVYNARLNNLQDIQTMFNWQDGDILTEDTEDLTLAYRNGIWMSNTDDVAEHISLSQRYSYRVKVQKAQKVELWGRAYKSKEERTLTIKPGWNSIGYTPLLNLPVATALADYFDRATSGDVVKSQTEFAMFTSDGKGGGQWLGNLRYMQPGEGYQLYRQKADTVSFTYPFYEPGETFIDLSQPQSHRAPMLFSTTMSLVAEAVDIALEEGDRLVAYAGGEQVGEAVLCSAKVSQNTQQQPLFFLSIEGDVEAPLSFAIMRNGETIATTEEVMTYKANGISGSPTEPTQISFVKTTDQPQQGWYTLDGIKLPAAPKRSGVYLYNGRKRIVK